MISALKTGPIRLIKEKEVFIGTRGLDAIALVSQYEYLKRLN